jgi:mRNA interferase RelE/StbE
VESYKVFLAASAAKELEAIGSRRDLARIVSAIDALRDNPRHPGVEKLAGGGNRYRVRVGDWRVVYAVDDRAKVVDVVKIGHRREAYR